MNDLLRELLTMSLGGSLAALLLLGLRALLRRRMPHRVFYYLWLLVLLRLCLPLPGFLHWQSPAVPAEAPIPAAAQSAGEPSTESMVLTETTAEAEESLYAGAEMESTEPLSSPADALISDARTVPTVLHAERVHVIDYPLILTLLWAAGAVVSILWFADGYALFARKIRRTARSATQEEQALLLSLRPRGDVALLRSPFAFTPMLMGFLHPAIVLPDRELLPGELECVLRHELTHYRRLDLPYKWFAMLALCLHWFNPMSYLIRHYINRDCELSCDEMVIAPMSPREKQIYGETLIRLAGNHTLPAGVPATTLCESKEHLRQRLVSIMEYRPLTRTATILSLLCALLLCGCAAALGSGSEEAAAPTPDAEEIYIRSVRDNYATAGDALRLEDGSVAELSSGGTPSGYAFATDGNACLSEENQVTVSTVEELLNAMSTSTTVILRPGVYDLNEAGSGVYSFAYWKPLGGGMGHQLMSHYLHNLKLVGESGNSADVVIRGGGGLAPLMSFRNCYNMNFSHLTFQSGPEGDFPGGAVLHFQDCYSLYMEDCVFSDEDCGAELQLEDCQSVTLKSCILSPAESSYFSHCAAVLLEDCLIEPRPTVPDRPPIPLFNISDVCFRRCTLGDAPLRTEDLLGFSYPLVKSA